VEVEQAEALQPLEQQELKILAVVVAVDQEMDHLNLAATAVQEL
jgi:hypothetical protein